MANFLDLDSFGKNGSKDFTDSIKHILPHLEETIELIKRSNTEAFFSKKHTKTTDATVAKEVVKLQAQRDTLNQLITILKGVVEENAL